MKIHKTTFGLIKPIHKQRSRHKGSLLIESMMSLALLIALGLVLLKLSMNILVPRQWVIRQVVSDAYMSYERAFAERIPFDELTGVNSPWPVFGGIPGAITTNVEIGRLPRIQPNFPNGMPLMGTVTRTRFASGENYPVDGGTGTLLSNPAAMKVWRLQSVLTYTVGNRSYAKSRTVLRTQ